MKPTTKHQIQDYLQLSSEEYEEMVLHHYWSYCHKYSTSDQMLQCLLSNSSVNKYFLDGFARYENEFLKMVENTPKQLDRLQYHYKGCIIQIYKYYNQPLLDKLKPLKNQEVVYLSKINKLPFYAN